MLFSEFKAQRMEELKAYRDGATNSAVRVPGLLDLIEMTKPRHVIEIGCFTGISTEVFLLHCAGVTAIDCWNADFVEREFDSRVGAYPNLIKFKGHSPDAIFKYIPHQSFDLCYIDADHSYEAVKADISACIPLVKVGGYIGGHDYGWYDTPGVKLAVDEILVKPDRVFKDSSWVVRL